MAHKPWWQIDLQKVEQVVAVAIFSGKGGRNVIYKKDITIKYNFRTNVCPVCFIYLIVLN